MLLKLRGVYGAVSTILCATVVGGCTLHEADTTPPLSAARLIATPPSHYSTQKARYLGEKYQQKLERLIEMITANRITSKLQFANSLGSSGGMGFFTHSAVKGPDERFLEVVLGTEENFEGGDYSVKVARLFSRYGRELLLILASDREIYNDREMSGYGLNFTWRSRDSRANTERAIVYFPKEKVRAFLSQDMNDNTLLADAVIFVIEPEGQANLLSFRAQDPAPDVRAPIKEQVLLPLPAKEEAELKRLLAERPVKSTEPIKPATNAGESSAGDKDKGTGSSKRQTEPKPITRNVTVKTREEIVPDEKVGPGVDGNIEPVGKASSRESGDQSDNSSMPARGVVETTQPVPGAAKFSQPQLGAEAIQSELQQKNSEGKTHELSSLVEVPKEKEQKESDPDLAGSQIPALMQRSRPNEASEPQLGIQAPVPGSTEVPLSSDKTPEPGGKVERLSDIASIGKISPKTAHTETAVPAPITPSGLKNAEGDNVERHSVFVHPKPIENIPAKSFVRHGPKSLEGYIIQVPFKDRSDARSWADTFEQRGYAVSITEADGGESLRVRLGNFRMRDDAERQLKSIREDGLIGIILNLPQAYRPEIRSSLP
jgi:SPOR domain